MSDDTFGGKPWEDLDTHPPGDWAETRAREWLLQPAHEKTHEQNVSDLAALLREVRQEVAEYGEQHCREHRAEQMAEVRRVVEDVRLRWETHSVAPLVADEILARLEKL